MGDGILYVIDQLGHTLAAKQAEVEKLQAENTALREALMRQTPSSPEPA